MARAWEPNLRKLQRQHIVRCSREYVWYMSAIDILNAFYSYIKNTIVIMGGKNVLMKANGSKMREIQ